MPAVVRVAVPAAVVLAMTSIVAVSVFNPFRILLPKLPVDMGNLVVSGTKITMESPHLAGFSTDQRPYEMWAKAAIQDLTDPDHVELKTLRAVERLPAVRQHNTMYNGLYQVPTLQEYLDTAKRLSGELHRQVGVYIETKHPTFFRAQGIDVDKMLVDELNKNNLNTPDAKVFIESFETNLKQLRDQLKVPLVQLIDSTGAPADWVAAGDKRTYADMIKPVGLAEVAKYAQAIGPDKTLIIPTDPAGNPGPATTLVTDAHAVGLKLHPYTFRNENQFLPADLRSSANPVDYGKAIDEDVRFFKLGVDGIFTDNTDTGLVARAEYLTTH